MKLLFVADGPRLSATLSMGLKAGYQFAVASTSVRTGAVSR